MLGSLLVYGVLTRMLLLGFSRLMLALVRRRYQLDPTLQISIKAGKFYPDSRLGINITIGFWRLVLVFRSIGVVAYKRLNVSWSRLIRSLPVHFP
ncbi:DUF2868 domain-containing protein [Exilibacterium tricleocarpae]|uniref:DUF2868 domain-containing protein n=1 Tax=Exilibacterium tricleocarpae TaxID=2591008 RepID=A0A545UA23_9GAMM|nr:DUF2868 domain-containing protein [Exilibacterium tricleocarpae]